MQQSTHTFCLIQPLLTRARRLWGRFTAPVPALPLDLFRIGIGLTAAGYFWRTRGEAADISSLDGLVDHGLLRRMFWYTRISLFPPRLTLPAFRAVYGLAAAGSLLLALGIGSKAIGALLYLIAVSTYRWNFLCMYVDDAIMHLMLLWTLLLPTGRTLTLPGWLRDRRGAWARWRETTAPGTAVRCFLGNLALIYLVAGLWKWRSPLWRRGLALYAVLKCPVSLDPRRWQRRHLPLLKVGNYLALLLEPLLPLAFVLPRGHPLKWLFGAALIGFHGGIIASMKVPFANWASLASAPIVFCQEIGGCLGPERRERQACGRVASGLAVTDGIAACLTVCLTLAMLWNQRNPEWHSGVRGPQDRAMSPRQNPFYALLYLLGVVQSYRLFDWIDDRNYHVTHEVTERGVGGASRPLEAARLFPTSLRSQLLQSYLLEIKWIKVPAVWLPALQQSLYRRFARRFCRQCGNSGRIEADVLIQRTTPDNLDLRRPQRVRLIEFTCRDGEPEIHFMRERGE